MAEHGGGLGLDQFDQDLSTLTLAGFAQAAHQNAVGATDGPIDGPPHRAPDQAPPQWPHSGDASGGRDRGRVGSHRQHVGAGDADREVEQGQALGGG